MHKRQLLWIMGISSLLSDEERGYHAAQRICTLPSFDRWCQQGIHTRVRKPTNLVGLNELNIYISFDFNINGKTERHQTPKGW